MEAAETSCKHKTDFQYILLWSHICNINIGVYLSFLFCASKRLNKTFASGFKADSHLCFTLRSAVDELTGKIANMCVWLTPKLDDSKTDFRFLLAMNISSSYRATLLLIIMFLATWLALF